MAGAFSGEMRRDTAGPAPPWPATGLSIPAESLGRVTARREPCVDLCLMLAAATMSAAHDASELHKLLAHVEHITWRSTVGSDLQKRRSAQR